MITAIELENFKGISGRVRIELAPVTLFFGANNAGKSTFLHALLYMLEALESGKADIDRTALSGEGLDLGGFERLVHQNDQRRTMHVLIEIDLPNPLNIFARDLSRSPWANVDDAFERAWIEVRSGYMGRDPTVTEVLIGSVGDRVPLARLHLDALNERHDPGQYSQVEFNLDHPLIKTPVEESEPDTDGSGEFRVNALWTNRIPITAVPDLTIPLPITQERSTDDGIELRIPCDILVIAPLREAVAALRDVLYVGPLRTVPSRTMSHHRSVGIRHWSDGLAAWDALYRSPALLDATNRWLEILGVAARLFVRRYEAAKVDAEDVTFDAAHAVIGRLLVSDGRRWHGERLPSDLGVGVSQLVPVLAASLEGSRHRIVMIEQPELHIHPALQVALGDLFIEQCASRQFIIETHSEHLILRILRRIRETTANELPPGAPRFDPTRLSVLYVEPSEDGTKVRRLNVDDTGEFTDRWPAGFFEERAEELF